MSIVDVHNEWDPLEEVIIGHALGARTPSPGIDLQAIEFPDVPSPSEIPSGPFDPGVISETAEELDAFSEALRGLGIRVRRPTGRDTGRTVATPDWVTTGLYDYCPRDVLLTVADCIIETPMVLRSRFLEPWTYKDLLLEYFASGARWFSAPKPKLQDSLYSPEAAQGDRLLNLEPVFDAANVLRLGTDLLYLVSDSGNESGARWLESMLGPTYTVHRCRGLYASTHIDSTVVPLRPGLVLLNPARVNQTNLPPIFSNWDKLYCPELVDIGYSIRPRASLWIGMNLLMVNPDLAVVDSRQARLIEALERRGIDVLPLTLTHARTLGGGFHCTSLDVRRRGLLESYR